MLDAMEGKKTEPMTFSPMNKPPVAALLGRYGAGHAAADIGDGVDAGGILRLFPPPSIFLRLLLPLSAKYWPSQFVCNLSSSLFIDIVNNTILSDHNLCIIDTDITNSKTSNSDSEYPYTTDIPKYQLLRFLIC